MDPKKSGVCYLIGAGEHYNNVIPHPDSDDYIIAVDGGSDYCAVNNITPDLIVGDWDSISHERKSHPAPCGNQNTHICADGEPARPGADSVLPGGTSDMPVPVMSFPPEKDYTDMALAAKEALNAGYRTILIYGGTGGRPDHTFANIQLLSYIAACGARAYLFDEKYTMTAITNSVLDIHKGNSDKYGGFITSDGFGYISVFSLSDKSKGVTIEGLKYTTDNITLDRMHAMGVSNEFTDNNCSIKVTEGSLLIVLQTAPQTLKIH